MPLATIVGTLLLLVQPAVSAPWLFPAIQTQAEQPQQNAPPAPLSPAAPSEEKSAEKSTAPAASAKPSAKPCPGVSAANSEAKPDCKPVSPSKASRRKRKPPRQPSGTGSTKTVVRNGSTSDPAVAISPSVNQQQASRQLQATNQMLAKTEANLKAIEGRQLNPGQQDTVKQIGSYMEQARTAANNGDVQRAYNLAHKASMLSADLLGH